MIGCFRTRVRKQPIIALILSFRMNSSFLTPRPGFQTVLSSVIFFKSSVFIFLKTIYESYNLSNKQDLTKTKIDILSVVKQVHSVCKGYEQSTLVDKELRGTRNILKDFVCFISYQ